MTEKQAKLKKYLIKMVHTLKHDYFPDEECRYAYMEGKFGKISTKDMSIDELRQMLLDMGFKNNKKEILNREKSKNEPLKATQKQIDTIISIWENTARVKTSLALRNFIARILKKDYLFLHLNYMSAKEASKVIVALRALDKYNKTAKGTK